MYSLIFYQDHEILTVDGVNVTVPIFFAANTALDFLRRLEKPWRSGVGEDDGRVSGDKELELQNQLGLPVTEEGDTASEDAPSQDHISRGWVWPRIGDLELTISFDYDGADKPYQMPPELAGNRTARPFFHTDAEMICLRTAVDNWLVPQVGARRPHTYLKPDQQFVAKSVQIPDDPDIHKRLAAIQSEYGFAAMDEEYRSLWVNTYMEGILNHRLRSVSNEIMITTDGHGNRGRSKLFHSDSFLALAWIEIMWALDHDIHAQICQNCGTVFRLGGPYTRKAYLCSAACRRERRIENRGGPEELREYNRIRKRASRQRHRRS